jgi:hypothetical protein
MIILGYGLLLFFSALAIFLTYTGQKETKGQVLTPQLPQSHLGKSPSVALKLHIFIQVRLLPATILYSNKRHSIAPLNSGVRRETDRRINFGMRKSDVNR